MSRTSGRSQNAEWPINLRKALDRYFSEEDIEVLCFDLNIDCDSLSGETKSRRIVSLIQTARRTDRINDLIDTCSQHRPNVPWNEIKAAAIRYPSAVDLRYEFGDGPAFGLTSAGGQSQSSILGIPTRWIVVLIFALGIATTFIISISFYLGLGDKDESYATQTAQAAAAITGTAEALIWADADRDGLTDADEEDLGTDPLKEDTDGDGLTDREEVNGPTDPLEADTDGDGLNDGDERAWGSDPQAIDTDGDTLLDGQEVHQENPSSPVRADSDGDGLNDNIDPEPGQLPTSTPTATDAPTSTPTSTSKPTPTNTPTPRPTNTPTRTPTPTPATNQLWSYEMELSTDRKGYGDYYQFTPALESPWECKEACEADNRCLAWTYREPSTSDRARCYLKEDVPPGSSAEGFISGIGVRAVEDQFEVDVDRFGDDYYPFTPQESNPLYCYRACQDDDRCASWTFGFRDDQPRCWLKSGMGSPRYVRNFISGVKGTIEWNTDRYGSDYDHIALPVQNPWLCKRHCEEDEECRAWTLVMWGDCLLKDAVPGPTYKADVISGVKGE